MTTTNNIEMSKSITDYFGDKPSKPKTMPLYTRKDGFGKRKGYLGDLVEEVENPLILGKQYNDGDKQYENTMSYRRFSSERALDKFINTKTNKNTNLFEMITTDTPKIYFDIDKCNMTKTELVMFECRLRDTMMKYLNTPVMAEAVIWTRREEHNLSGSDDGETEKRYTSIHLTYPYCRTTKENIKSFVVEWNKNNSVKLDNAVYGKNQAFNMPYQSKAKYNKLRAFKLLNLWGDKNKDINTRFIGSHFDNCIIYALTMEFKIKAYIIPNTAKTSVNAWITSAVFNMTNEINITNNTSLTKNTISSTKNITHSVNNHSIVKTLINLVEDERITKNLFSEKLWKCLTQQMILHEVDDIDVWLKYSADKSDGGFSINDNLTYKSKVLKEPKFKGDIQKSLDSVNTNNCLKIRYIWRDNVNIDKLEWLSVKMELPVDIIKTNITTTLEYDPKQSKKPKFVDFKDGKFRWDFNRLLLYDNTEKTTMIYNEKIYKKIYGVNFENGWNKSSVEELSKISLDWFNDKKSSIMAVNAKWGTGKTHYCLNSLIQHSKTIGTRVCIITENNALNREYVVKFNGVSHLNKSRLSEQEPLIICSLESIHKLKDWDYGIIVLDEYESILNHFESETMENPTSGASGYNNMVVLFDKIRNADKVIALDADLTDKRLEILTTIKPTIINKQYITENRWETYTHNLYHDDKESFLTDLMMDLSNGKKVVLPTSSKKFGNVVYEMVRDNNPSITICMINADGVLLIRDGVLVKTDTADKIMKNLTEWLISNDIKLFIHSPSIKTGVSINEPIFHSVYAKISDKSCCVREFIQMLYRCRTTIDTTINILCEYESAEYLKCNDADKFKTMIANNIEFKIHSKTKFGIDTMVVFNPDIDYYKNQNNAVGNRTNELYLSVRSINLEETEMSRVGMIHEIIGKIGYNHNITITHKYPTRLGYEKHIIKYKECADDIKNREIKEFLECGIITDKEAVRLSNKQLKQDINNPITDIERQLLNKYYKMRKLGIGGYYTDDKNQKSYNRLYQDENTLIYDNGSITESHILDKSIPIKDQMSEQQFNSIDWDTTKLYPITDNDNKAFYITTKPYDYRIAVNDNWINRMKLNGVDDEDQSSIQVVADMMTNKTNIETINTFKTFIPILNNKITYDIDEVNSGELDGVITTQLKSKFDSNGLTNLDITKNQLYILKYFWKLLKLDLTNKIQYTNKRFNELITENAVFIKNVASKEILIVYPNEKYLTTFNPTESSHIKKLKTLIKRVLKLIGYGYDYAKTKKYDSVSGKRIYDKNCNKPSAVMYFGKDLEFGFDGSIRLTNNNNDNDKLPPIVYNVKSSETNKKGRGVYYKGEKMDKLTGSVSGHQSSVSGHHSSNEDRYVNYKPKPHKLNRDDIINVNISYELCLRKIDLGIFYGFNMKYYVEDKTKNQQQYHRQYMEKYGDTDKCLITDIDADADDDCYNYKELDEGVDSDSD